MRHSRFGTLALWSSLFAPGLLVCAALIVASPAYERPIFIAPLVIYVGMLVAFALVVARDYRGGSALLEAAEPGATILVTQNVPAAIVHLEPFVLPEAPFARGRTFVIVADSLGLSYFTPGKRPVVFVRIPWSEIDHVGEIDGYLCVRLSDGNLLMHIPGGLLPNGRRRVRALAAEITALQRERQL